MTFPSLYELLNTELPDEKVPNVITSINDKLRSEQFRRWYRAQEFTTNIQRGQSYFNKTTPIPEPHRHSPSQLLQCHRKIYYRQYNAPEEASDPTGIFWIGEKFETELIIPYLKRITGNNFHVQNSLWIDFTIRSRIGDLHLKGETDPVFVDMDGEPFLLTEVKTKDSVEHLSSPNEHHLAQAHAYMYGLTQKYKRQITESLLVYADRTTLDLKVFHKEFDPVFWRNRVLDWAASHSEYRIKDRLPPADPEFGWECKFCSYRERCGKGKTEHSDRSSVGLLPGFKEYPREKVIEYLESHPDEALTPVLAHKYSDLVEIYGVVDLYCHRCDLEIDWKEIESANKSVCPQCGKEDEITTCGVTDSPSRGLLRRDSENSTDTCHK